MKLTSEEIEIISNYIEFCGIKEIDIKFELVDHIASQTEEIMTNDAVSFDEALKSVMPKWYPLFINEKSFHLGFYYTFPKIVLKKMESRIKKTYIYLLALFIIWISSFYIAKVDLANNEILNSILNYSSVLLGISITTILILANYKSKPTTFRFLINHSSPILLFLVFLLLFDSEMNFFKSYIFVLTLIQFIFMCINFNSHSKCIKKYRLA